MTVYSPASSAYYTGGIGTAYLFYITTNTDGADPAIVKPDEQNRYWNTNTSSANWNEPDEGKDAKGSSSARFPDGRLTVKVTASDQAGNKGDRSAIIILDNFQPFRIGTELTLKSIDVFRDTWTFGSSSGSYSYTASGPGKITNTEEHILRLHFSEPLQDAPTVTFGSDVDVGGFTSSDDDRNWAASLKVKPEAVNGLRPLSVCVQGCKDLAGNPLLAIGKSEVTLKQPRRDSTGAWIDEHVVGTDTRSQIAVCILEVNASFAQTPTTDSTHKLTVGFKYGKKAQKLKAVLFSRRFGDVV